MHGNDVQKYLYLYKQKYRKKLVTPTNAPFCILFVLHFTKLLHVSALLSHHLQGADTKVSIKLTAIK
jgi:hypothetical protein